VPVHGDEVGGTIVVGMLSFHLWDSLYRVRRLPRQESRVMGYRSVSEKEFRIRTAVDAECVPRTRRPEFRTAFEDLGE
jgi:hypothetical protein